MSVVSGDCICFAIHLILNLVVSLDTKFNKFANIMGANSVDISQYRSRIGTFVGKKIACGPSKASIGNRLKSNTIMNSFIMLSYLLVISNVTQILLIISGVELNPGPGPEAGNKYIISACFC